MDTSNQCCLGSAKEASFLVNPSNASFLLPKPSHNPLDPTIKPKSSLLCLLNYHGM